ncbi:MAG: hypothetical protein WBZ36_06125 [Candidatus Nitrosopolaris sp.]
MLDILFTFCVIIYTDFVIVAGGIKYYYYIEHLIITSHNKPANMESCKRRMMIKRRRKIYNVKGTTCSNIRIVKVPYANQAMIVAP